MSRKTRTDEIRVNELIVIDNKTLNECEIKRKYSLINLAITNNATVCCKTFGFERTTLYRLKTNYLKIGLSAIYTRYQYRGKKNF